MSPVDPHQHDHTKADDTAAIQAAVDVALSVGDGVVLLSAGTFKIKEIHVMNGNVYLRGVKEE